MFSLFLHMVFILIVFYYVYVYNTDYDKKLYMSANDLRRFFTKTNKTAGKKLHEYTKKQHQEEKREERIDRMKQNCNNCDIDYTSEHKRKECRLSLIHI